jgi:hypothetical protein
LILKKAKEIRFAAKALFENKNKNKKGGKPLAPCGAYIFPE